MLTKMNICLFLLTKSGEIKRKGSKMPKHKIDGEVRKEHMKKVEEERKRKEQENENKYRKHYLSFWDKHFPEGAQTIYSVGGNSDSSDSETSLIVSCTINPNLEKELEKKKVPTKFKCYKDLFQCILDNKDEFNDFFCHVNGSYEDEVGIYYNKVEKTKTAKQLFEVLLNYMINDIDPIILVRESNGLLMFLKDVRGF